MRLNGVGLYGASEAHKRAKSRNLRIIVQTVSSNRALILEKLPFIPLFLLMKGSQTSSRADFVSNAASVNLPLQHDLVIVLIYTHFPFQMKISTNSDLASSRHKHMPHLMNVQAPYDAMIANISFGGCPQCESPCFKSKP